MANRIKGITVEIGGDTTGLDKALKSVKYFYQIHAVCLKGRQPPLEAGSFQHGTTLSKANAS